MYRLRPLVNKFKYWNEIIQDIYLAIILETSVTIVFNIFLINTLSKAK